jgi:hypothetical protein
MNKEIQEAVSTERALDLALEALTVLLDEWTPARQAQLKGVEAVTAIKQARSAPYVASPRVQSAERGEPVGTYGEIYKSMQSLVRSGLQRDRQIYMAMKDKPLYATPPNVATPLAAPAPEERKRQWIGLTEAEVDECYESVMFNPDIEPTRVLVYQAIEAKLKERNV